MAKEEGTAHFLARLEQSEGRNALAWAFSQAVGRVCKEQDPRILLALYGLFSDLEDGHGCWELSECSRRIQNILQRDLGEDEEIKFTGPSAEQWHELLTASACADVPGGDGPLLLDAGRLYLRKMYQAEAWVAEYVGHALRKEPRTLDAKGSAALRELFAGAEKLEQDLQCIATVNAWAAPFAILAGGPGTGKTYSVVNYLALAVLCSPEPPSILLLAPTGKAAMRLAESIRAAKERLSLSPEQLALIPDQASTIHRALGLGGRASAQRDRQHPLEADLVVVDESSMVDLVMMAQLMDALSPQARLLLVGDAHQLASVDAGAVFGDLCLGHREWSPGAAWKEGIESCIRGGEVPLLPAPQPQDISVHLQVSRRFDPTRGIGQLARKILAGDEEGCLELLRDSSQQELRWLELDEESAASSHDPWRPWLAECAKGYQEHWRAQSPKERLLAGHRFQVLCATKKGPLGAQATNQALWRHAWPARQKLGERGDSRRAMSIMMTRNDPATGLSNGDVGIIDRDEDGKLRAYFESSGTEDGMRSLSLARLGVYEPAFAMSIHKSQGSEYDKVLIVLPPGASGGLSRELLYTALTRSKKQAWILASESAIRSCVRRRVHRRSGLGRRLL